MDYILFNNSETKYEGISISTRPTQVEGGTAIELIFPEDVPVVINTSGFKVYTDNDNIFMDCSEYTTIYMSEYGVNGYMLSNNKTEYAKPAPIVSFVSSVSNYLDGELMQRANDYADLVIPTIVKDDNYKFIRWNPSIPKKGAITTDLTFIAEFEYEESLEVVMQDKIKELDNACTNTIENGTSVEVDGNEYHFTYHKVDDQTNIKELFDATVSTSLPVSYHADGEECQDWTTLQFAKIYLSLAGYKSNNVSYYNALKHYVMSLTNKEEISTVWYGQELTGEYLATYNHAVETNTNLMMAILTKNGLKPEEVLGA